MYSRRLYRDRYSIDAMVLLPYPSSFSSPDFVPYIPRSLIQSCPFLPMIDLPFGPAFVREYFLHFQHSPRPPHTFLRAPLSRWRMGPTQRGPSVIDASCCLRRAPGSLRLARENCGPLRLGDIADAHVGKNTGHLPPPMPISTAQRYHTGRCTTVHDTRGAGKHPAGKKGREGISNQTTMTCRVGGGTPAAPK